jgi:hypothetical protein
MTATRTDDELVEQLKAEIIAKKAQQHEEIGKEPPPARKPTWQAEALRLRRDTPNLDIKALASKLELPYRTLWSYIKFIEEGNQGCRSK